MVNAIIKIFRDKKKEWHRILDEQNKQKQEMKEKLKRPGFKIRDYQAVEAVICKLFTNRPELTYSIKKVWIDVDNHPMVGEMAVTLGVKVGRIKKVLKEKCQVASHDLATVEIDGEAMCDIIYTLHEQKVIVYKELVKKVNEHLKFKATKAMIEKAIIDGFYYTPFCVKCYLYKKGLRPSLDDEPSKRVEFFGRINFEELERQRNEDLSK